MGPRARRRAKWLGAAAVVGAVVYKAVEAWQKRKELESQAAAPTFAVRLTATPAVSDAPPAELPSTASSSYGYGRPPPYGAGGPVTLEEPPAPEKEAQASPSSTSLASSGWGSLQRVVADHRNQSGSDVGLGGWERLRSVVRQGTSSACCSISSPLAADSQGARATAEPASPGLQVAEPSSASGEAAPAASGESPLVREVRQLAQQSLDQAVDLFDSAAPEWVKTSDKDGVQLSNKYVEGARLPLARGVMEIPASEAPPAENVEAIFTTHAGRLFFDLLYTEAKILEECGPGAGLGCSLSPSVAGLPATYAINVVATRRLPCSTGQSRVINIQTKAPQHIIDTYTQGVVEWCGPDHKPSLTKIWAVEVLTRKDGGLRLGIAFLTDMEIPMLPVFMLKKVVIGAPTVMLQLVMRMAKAGMVPRHSLTVAGTDTEDTEEKTTASGHQMQISKMLANIFVAEGQGSP